MTNVVLFPQQKSWWENIEKQLREGMTVTGTPKPVADAVISWLEKKTKPILEPAPLSIKLPPLDKLTEYDFASVRAAVEKGATDFKEQEERKTICLLSMLAAARVRLELDRLTDRG